VNVPSRYSIAGGSASEVAASVEEAVRTGALAPGAPLPPVRALAAQLGLSAATVASAYRSLRLRGLASGAGRRGTRITARPPLAPERPSPPASGLRDVAEGNPDPRLLPPLRPHRALLGGAAALYGAPAALPELIRLASRDLARDGIPAAHLAVLGGAMDAIERVLQSHLRPGDAVAVEDPGYPAVIDLVGALGLVPRPVALDESGPLPADLDRVLRSGASALVLTPRAQNPTGAAVDAPRARELRDVLARHPAALVIEDDHAGPVAGVPVRTLCDAGRDRWAVVRSVSKSLGPDLRVAILAGDAATVARVRGRQGVGAGWVSHVLQGLVAALWSDPSGDARLRRAADAYAERRRALLAALAGHGVAGMGRSGLNVWIPVREEAATVAHLAVRGWSVRAGERYRIKSPPAVRITVSTLTAREIARLAADVAESQRSGGRTSAA
jgi:DNA-binding transcriptional MocR family regulator